jgi:hypothetical protein
VKGARERKWRAGEGADAAARVRTPTNAARATARIGERANAPMITPPLSIIACPALTAHVPVAPLADRAYDASSGSYFCTIGTDVILRRRVLTPKKNKKKKKIRSRAHARDAEYSFCLLYTSDAADEG